MGMATMQARKTVRPMDRGASTGRWAVVFPRILSVAASTCSGSKPSGFGVSDPCC